MNFVNFVVAIKYVAIIVTIDKFAPKAKHVSSPFYQAEFLKSAKP